MSIPPLVVATARMAWRLQWNQMMNGLAPADKAGNYLRPSSQHKKAIAADQEELTKRSLAQLPRLIIGRSCPWAHRTWLIHQLRGLGDTLIPLIVKADHNAGRWRLDPPWLGCNSLLDLYKACGSPPSHRATVPVIVDPGATSNHQPRILGNESAQLVEMLNDWPTNENSMNLAPKELKDEINQWQKLLQPSVNDGVYRCGFARTQSAYEKASKELFEALRQVNESLSKKNPWLCGDQLTLADIRLFPTMVRWEMVYMPLFGCSQEQLWNFPHIWEWRKRFMSMQFISGTCDAAAWRNDYFGALFPLHPSSIVPSGPDLAKMINASPPTL